MSQSPFSILYAEDEPKIAALVVTMLSERNCQVEHLTKAQEACNKSDEQVYDLVLVDLVLEEGHGKEIIAHIRSNPENPNHFTPIMVISAQIDGELMTDVFDKIQGAIVKPFKLETLCKKVGQVLNGDQEISGIHRNLLDRHQQKQESDNSSQVKNFFFPQDDQKED